ncbi:MAG: hypothetical protein ABWY00_09605 [Dongiaceae bacterium]
MLSEAWQQDRIFTTPVGTLTASFLLHPNTMFHRDGEWSVRLILPQDRAHLLRQTIAPAYEDILRRGRDRFAVLPFEQQIARPFRENPYWQPVQTDGGLETDDLYFTFRAPTSEQPLDGAAAEPVQVPLFCQDKRESKTLQHEPDGQEGIVSFSIQQFWLRSFGAGVNLRLRSVELLAPRAKLSDDPLHQVHLVPALGG